MAPLSRHINAWKSLALAALWAAALHSRAASYPRAALTLTTWTAYTLLWLLKSAVIPDKRWDKEASQDQRVVVWTLLNLHLVAPLTLLLAPNRAPPLPPTTLFTTVASFALGTFLHVAADAYKAGALAARPRHLVTGGPFRLCRNPNYLGSALQYVGLLAPAAPALGRASPLAFTGIALFIAIEWLPNMAAKDASLRTQHGAQFAEWARSAPLFLPSVGSVYRALIGWWLGGGGEAGESTVAVKTAATQTAEEVIEVEVTAAAAATARGRRRAPKAA